METVEILFSYHVRYNMTTTFKINPEAPTNRNIEPIKLYQTEVAFGNWLQ